MSKYSYGPERRPGESDEEYIERQEDEESYIEHLNNN